MNAQQTHITKIIRARSFSSTPAAAFRVITWAPLPNYHLKGAQRAKSGQKICTFSSHHAAFRAIFSSRFPQQQHSVPQSQEAFMHPLLFSPIFSRSSINRLQALTPHNSLQHVAIPATQMHGTHTAQAVAAAGAPTRHAGTSKHLLHCPSAITFAFSTPEATSALPNQHS